MYCLGILITIGDNSSLVTNFLSKWAVLSSRFVNRSISRNICLLVQLANTQEVR